MFCEKGDAAERLQHIVPKTGAAILGDERHVFVFKPQQRAVDTYEFAAGFWSWPQSGGSSFVCFERGMILGVSRGAEKPDRPVWLFEFARLLSAWFAAVDGLNETFSEA